MERVAQQNAALNVEMIKNEFQLWEKEKKSWTSWNGSLKVVVHNHYSGDHKSSQSVQKVLPKEMQNIQAWWLGSLERVKFK